MRIVRQDNPATLEMLEFLGLELQPDVMNRPPNSWRRLENCDLFIPGSIRKVVGPQLAFGPFPSVILEMLSYRRDNSGIKLVGVGTDGHLYNLTTLADLGLAGVVDQPFMCVFPGTAAGGDSILYLIVTLNGAAPRKFDGTNFTAIGVSAPAASATITPTFSAANSNAYLMQVGIQYGWTYFNPDTLHESSISPVLSTAICTPTTNAPPAATPYITQVKIDIPTPDPTIGDGYTRIRVYRTRDGGATFYLPPALYNAAGVNQSDSEGSVARVVGTTTIYDGVAASNIQPTPDQLLVNPPQGAPAIGENDPPPNAVWGAVYQNRLWLVDKDLITLRFSQLGDFQSFGINDFFKFAKDSSVDTITSLAALSDRLIVNGRNSARQITGTDFSDFVEVPIDMRRGCVGRRASVNDGDVVYQLTAQSLARLAFAQSGPPFVGDKVKPLTDTIVKASYLTIINAEIDTQQSILLLAMKINGVTYNDQILACDLSRESPFSVIKGLPTEVVTIKELETEDQTKTLYFSGADKNIYKLYGGQGTLTAVAETQQLPLTDLDIWKLFKNVSAYGTDFGNWQVAYSVDGRPFTPLRELSIRTPCGMAGSVIVFQFIHNVNNGIAALLSRFMCRYELKMADPR